MKKIGILTYTKEYSNLGTNMQSYCTLKAIQRQFPNEQVELINYSRWEPIKKPYLSQISFKSLVNDYVRIKKYEHFFKNNCVFSEKKFVSPDLMDSIDYIKQQKYDAIYVGSDTILELKRVGKNEITAYWLDANINCKKFLIAASSHKETFEKLSAIQIDAIQNNINDFALLGVRDEATFRLLSHFTKLDDDRLQLIPDPTFTFDIDYSYIEEYFKRKKLVFKKPIICLHLTRNTKWAYELANHFRKEGYVIASLRPAYYADLIFTDLDPFEQVGLYKYFDLVITHRFHDAIFSIKNLTPVIVFPEYFTEITSYGENKNKTLFKEFNIVDNYIDKKENLSAAYLFDMHKRAIDNCVYQKDFIKETLLKNKNIYESFVKKSSAIINNETYFQA